MKQLDDLSKRVRVVVISTAVTVATTAFLSFMVYGAKSYADNNYVQQSEFQTAQVTSNNTRLEDKIEAVDAELLKIRLQLARTTDPRDVADLGILQEYYTKLRDKYIREKEDSR